MRNSLLLFMMLFMSLSYSFGQTKEKGENLTPAQIAGRQTDKMENRYSLTADQKEQVYKINLETAEKLNDLKKIKMPQDEYKKRKEDILQAQRTQIAAVMNAEQKEKFKADNQKYDSKNKQ